MPGGRRAAVAIARTRGRRGAGGVRAAGQPREGRHRRCSRAPMGCPGQSPFFAQPCGSGRPRHSRRWILIWDGSREARYRVEARRESPFDEQGGTASASPPNSKAGPRRHAPRPGREYHRHSHPTAKLDQGATRLGPAGNTFGIPTQQQSWAKAPRASARLGIPSAFPPGMCPAQTWPQHAEG